MKISKSKRQLAQLLIEAGVTQFPEGANWAAQDSCGSIYLYERQPVFKSGSAVFDHGGGRFEFVFKSKKIPNWHQTALSCDKFDRVVSETVVSSEQDDDGWIEWGGDDEAPVSGEVFVDVKHADDDVESGCAGDINWGWENAQWDIIAYRLHKPEQAEAPDEGKSPEQRAKLARIYAPTLDQLLQDWRNADDYAQRKQTEADEAAAMRDERWKAVQARAGEMGVTVGRCEPEQGLVITDWNDLRVGDEIEYIDGSSPHWVGRVGVVELIDKDHDPHILFRHGDKGNSDDPTNWISTRWCSEFRFIRRP